MIDPTDISELADHQIVDDRYRLSHLLRTGGMSRIYLAEDIRLFNRQVVVKLLTLHTPATDRQLRKWFAREAQVSAMLGNHPRIVTVHDYGVDFEQPYIVMEYLGQPPQGCDLETYMAMHGRIEAQQVVNFGSQICSGLAHAHEYTTHYEGQLIQGVIHRDLKPSNLFVIQQDVVGETIKILDFGIAKILDEARQRTASNIGFVGTLSHASPEQMRGEQLTPKSDIYSLGVVLYKMLTGVSPFCPPSASFQDWYTAHTKLDPLPFDPITSASIPQALEDIVMSCLAKDPCDRPQSMQVLREGLELSIMQSPFTNTAQVDTQREVDLVEENPPFVQDPLSETTPVNPDFTPSQHRLLPLLQERLVPVVKQFVGAATPVLIKEVLKMKPSCEEFIHSLSNAILPSKQRLFLVEAHRILAELHQIDLDGDDLDEGERHDCVLFDDEDPVNDQPDQARTESMMSCLHYSREELDRLNYTCD